MYEYVRKWILDLAYCSHPYSCHARLQQVVSKIFKVLKNLVLDGVIAWILHFYILKLCCLKRVCHDTFTLNMFPGLLINWYRKDFCICYQFLYCK